VTAIDAVSVDGRYGAIFWVAPKDVKKTATKVQLYRRPTDCPVMVAYLSVRPSTAIEGNEQRPYAAIFGQYAKSAAYSINARIDSDSAGAP
jgi:hypothetical protein